MPALQRQAAFHLVSSVREAESLSRGNVGAEFSWAAFLVWPKKYNRIWGEQMKTYQQDFSFLLINLQLNKGEEY